MRHCLAFAATLGLAAAAGAAVDPGAAVAPRAEFTPPAVGSYHLERIQHVTDAVLLDGAGGTQRLSNLTSGKITLLTFFYTYCADPLGCPFAYATLTDLRARVLAEHGLAPAVRFVSVSLDPSTDTPAAIARYGGHLAADPQLEWRFVTARSVAQLLPVLEDFGQDVSVEADQRGRPTRTLHHMLKMFLLDRQGVVREIYTLAYLQPEVMFNDIRTLVGENDRPR